MKKGLKVKQRDMTDCAAACLASVAAFYDLQLPISLIRQFSGTDKRGTNILGLTEAAEHLGFQAKGAKGNIESLAKIPLPAIAHVILKSGLHHFVVIYKVNKTSIEFMDPGDGMMQKKSLAEFSEIWSSVLVVLIPGDDFVSGSRKTSNLSRFFQLLAPHKSMMLQAIVGAVVSTILGLSTAIYVQKVVDFVFVEGNLKLLNIMSLGMIVILTFQVLINYFKSLIGLKTGQNIDARLILGYYKHLLKLPQRFYDTMRVGEIISRVNDAVKIRIFVNEVALSIVVNVLIIAFSISIMFFYYWKLALIALLLVPIYIIIYGVSNKVNRYWQRLLMENSADLETEFVQSINLASTIKQFNLESHASLKTEQSFVKLLKSVYKSGVIGLQVNSISDFITRLFTIIILWAGGYFVVQRELSPGEILSFYALLGYLTSPAAALIGANKSIQDALIATDRLYEIIDLEIEAGNENMVAMVPGLMGNIEFKNVSFKYPGKLPIFNNLSFSIQKKETTAIIGESGSGKSTLTSLIQNTYPLSEGSVLIGDYDLKHVSNDSLRKIVSVVPQKIELFSGTIIENIAVGDYQPDMQRILMLSRLLGIDMFVEQLPSNYNTMVTEQGNNFSGGQKQRIAIARALYRDPEVLILDEATSSLDPASEIKVQDAIRWFKGLGKTVIIIAHRLTTIKSADTIIVLEGGKIIEQGKHDDLIKLEGKYTSLWQYHIA